MYRRLHGSSSRGRRTWVQSPGRFTFPGRFFQPRAAGGGAGHSCCPAWHWQWCRGWRPRVACFGSRRLFRGWHRATPAPPSSMMRWSPLKPRTIPSVPPRLPYFQSCPCPCLASSCAVFPTPIYFVGPSPPPSTSSPFKFNGAPSLPDPSLPSEQLPGAAAWSPGRAHPFLLSEAAVKIHTLSILAI